MLSEFVQVRSHSDPEREYYTRPFLNIQSWQTPQCTTNRLNMPILPRSLLSSAYPTASICWAARYNIPSGHNEIVKAVAQTSAAVHSAHMQVAVPRSLQVRVVQCSHLLRACMLLFPPGNCMQHCCS